MEKTEDSKMVPLIQQFQDNWGKENDYFLNFFTDVYENVKKESIKNRDRNEFFKGIFLLVVAGIPILYGRIYFVVAIVYGKNAITVFDVGLFILLWTMAAGVVSKWVDIKKYQETWVRHSMHLHYMNREMLMFLENLDAYDSILEEDMELKRKVFKKKMLKIWDENQIRFEQNMRKPETSLMDVFRHVGKK